LYEVELNDPTESSDVAGGGPTGRASGSVMTFSDGGLHFVEVLRLRPTEKVRFVQEVLREEIYCERCIRAVNCMSVSWGAERDERDVHHDEKKGGSVVPL
jgi:hypothetical protein